MRYLPRKWNLVILCVGGVMCMRRAVTLMVSKTTLRPQHIAGEGRDRFMVSKHGFGYFEGGPCSRVCRRRSHVRLM